MAHVTDRHYRMIAVASGESYVLEAPASNIGPALEGMPHRDGIYASGEFHVGRDGLDDSDSDVDGSFTEALGAAARTIGLNRLSLTSQRIARLASCLSQIFAGKLRGSFPESAEARLSRSTKTGLATLVTICAVRAT